jgi:GNAT superfamily N-acetyltransferase
LELRLCRPDELERSYAVENTVWAPFNWEAAGAIVEEAYDPALHLVAVTSDGEIVATINACPINWDGDPATLPAGGWSEIMDRFNRNLIGPSRYASAVGASILPAYQGGGLAGQLLSGLRDQAFKLGYQALLAPVRPTNRWRMPHLHISEYEHVRLPDGRHFDPWVRVHERVGGRIIGSCAASARFSGSREQWEGWLGMRLPDNGDVLCDRTIGYLKLVAGWGVLEEDSLWILHEPHSSG